MEQERGDSDPVQPAGEPKFWYSVWGLPPDDVSQRAKKLMSGLRSEYGGPDFDPHVTVLGAISLTEADAINKFRSAVDGLKAYPATVERISTGTFYYQCVFLLLKPSPEIVDASSHCCGHFGFTNSTPYMPHMSLLYADLSEEEKKAAQEKANALDDSISGLSFPITRVSVESYNNGAESDQSVTEIIIVRHGETEWNALHKMQGQEDIDLNDLGRQQASAVADRLSREADISAIYTSDLRRALDTANMIATRCGGIQVFTDQDLREKHNGVFQGQRYDPKELRKLFPQAYEALLSDDQEVPGGGESRAQVHKRGTEAMQRIAAKHKGERVVVVSHGALIQSLYKRACPGAHPGDIRNASIGVIVLSNGGRVWSVKTWNDFAHVNQIGVLESGSGRNQATA
ncbi:hypothetical protein V2J09_017292 [Rumex salicifolius]